MYLPGLSLHQRTLITTQRSDRYKMHCTPKKEQIACDVPPATVHQSTLQPDILIGIQVEKLHTIDSTSCKIISCYVDSLASHVFQFSLIYMSIYSSRTLFEGKLFMMISYVLLCAFASPNKQYMCSDGAVGPQNC